MGLVLLWLSNAMLLKLLTEPLLQPVLSVYGYSDSGYYYSVLFFTSWFWNSHVLVTFLPIPVTGEVRYAVHKRLVVQTLHFGLQIYATVCNKIPIPAPILPLYIHFLLTRTSSSLKNHVDNREFFDRNITYVCYKAEMFMSIFIRSL